MARLNLTELSSLRVSRHQIPAHNFIPNTSIRNKPLLIYHSCIPPSTSASSIEAHLKEIGVVTPQWRYTMYVTTHFHSTTHEVLCISSGKATLCKSSSCIAISTMKLPHGQYPVILMISRLWRRNESGKGRGFGRDGRCSRGSSRGRASSNQ
jgi:hypothetical protein